MRFERFAAVSCALVEIVIGEVVLRKRQADAV
jgi:hypothetical protein